MEIKPEDLAAKCERCNGEGRLVNDMAPSKFEEYVRTNGSPSYRETGTCDTCNGKGSIPTDSGKAVLDFLWKHQR